MHLLFLGYSSIVRRRVLPAARSVSAIDRISVASRSQGRNGAEGRVEGGGAVDCWYPDYVDALASARRRPRVRVGRQRVPRGVGDAGSRPRMRCHRRQAGVPRPGGGAGSGPLARKQKRGLAEATVFLFHPQAAALRALVDPAEAPVIRATATFSFPPLPPGDFRYREACGGGSLYDLGPTPPGPTGCCSASRRPACIAPFSRGIALRGTRSTPRSACC